MPKEVIHDDTPMGRVDSLCQCVKHAPVVETVSGDVGGRAWVDHFVLCDDTCPAVGLTTHPYREVRSERSEQSTPYALTVTWGRDLGNLQVATVNLPLTDGHDARSEELQIIREALDQLTEGLPPDRIKAVVTKAEDAAWRLNNMAQGYYVDLNRDRTNKLIKVLKRARDQAFGADE